MAAPGVSECPKGFNFAEMNIIHSGCEKDTINMVKRAIRMGYDTVVINHDIGDPFPSAADDEDLLFGGPPEKREKMDPDEEKRQEKNMKQIFRAKTIPDPFVIDEKLLDLTPIEHAGKRFRQYMRLTATLKEQSSVHNFFMNPQLKKYDLIAVRPEKEAILHTLTRKTDLIDIISLSTIQRSYGKQLHAIQNEGVGVEITYAEALADSFTRRKVLALGRQIMHSVRGKGIIFASGARSIADIRAPVDAMNMLCLFGVDSNKAKPYLSGFPLQVLLRAEAKKTVKGSLSVAEPNNVPSKKLTSSAALQRLLAVPEFKAQIEKVPVRKEEKKEEGGKKKETGENLFA